MRGKRIVLGGIAGAILLTGVVSVASGTPAILAQTPTGAAIYLIVGVAAPQLVLGRRSDDAIRIGMGLLAGVVGLTLLLSGLFVEMSILGESTFVNVMAIIVAGIVIGTIVREVRRSYVGARNQDG